MVSQKDKLAKTIKTVLFVWEGINKNGTTVKGEISAPSLVLAKAELRQQGIVPTKLKRKPVSLFKREKKITPFDIAVFSRQVSTMITASLPLVQALEVIGRGHVKPTMQALILSIKSDIEAGSSLFDSLRKHPRYFDELFCNLVDAGEQSGTLETMLQRVANYKERLENLKKKIRKALIYPAAVLLVAIAVSIILLVFVVPQFQTLFLSFGADLPAFTLLVLKLSNFFQKYWWLILTLLGAGGWFIFNARQRSKKFIRWSDQLLLKLPTLGIILQKAAIARYARTLAITFAAGLPLVEALRSVAGTVGNSIYSEAVIRIRDEVAIGQRIHFAMRLTNLFPNMVEQMVAIGEESGTLDNMLSKVADFYEEEVNNAVDNLSTLLEPVIIVILGIIVGGLVTAMYLPIFKLGSVV